jgi:hypothetical protein
MITLINFTGKDISHYNSDMSEVLSVIPSNGQLRIKEERKLLYYLGDIPVYEQIHGSIEGLPEEKEDVFIILPFLLAKSDYIKSLNRKDILIPSQTIKQNGKVVGFKSFSLA